MMMRYFPLMLPILAVVCLPAAAAEVDFTRDIAPIFTKHCISCHGADKQKGGLRLDSKSAALLGGDIGPAWTAGKADESELIKRVRGDNEDEIMPPKGEPLSKAQVALLTKWINEGATWPDGQEKTVGRRRSDHWSFQPVVRPPLPAVKDAKWPRNGIDHFILAQLEAQGIRPSPEADRYTLIRRVHLDLLGLLPTPQEADAFVKDASPDAYEKLVDRLLASPHYGERWGRHWLDQARYADSNGYSVDGVRTMWPYRDWVIQALNDDMPFDQFTIAQLAGDLLVKEMEQAQTKGGATSASATRGSELDTRNSLLIATAFHRNTMINQEGGVKDDQFRIEATFDRVATTSQVWLGLTMACAQCHTHKFDPITQKEYYQFFAFFNSTEDSNNVGPTVTLMTPQMEAEIAAMEKELAGAERKLRELDQAIKAAPKTEKGKATEKAQKLGEIEWSALDSVKAVSKGGATIRQLDDGSLLVGGKLPANDTYEITFRTKLPRLAAIRLEALPHDSLPMKGPGLAGNGNFVLTKVLIERGGKPLAVTEARASHEQPGYPIEDALDDERDSGWAINVGKGSRPGVRMNDAHEAQFLLGEAAPAEDAEFRVSLRFELNTGYLLGRFRLTATDDVSLLRPDTLPARSSREQLVKEIASLKKRIADARKGVPSVMVMRELPQPRESTVFIRGDFLRPGPAVTPDVPEVLPPLFKQGGTATTTQGSANPPAHPRNPKSIPDRLDLARWLVSPENPLTPRVTMNRMWMRYFPKGLVETEEDFGVQGSKPTHPELLDWLASELIGADRAQGPRTPERGAPWSMKHMHRLIVTSATYRQSSRHRDELSEIDPYNRLLARQSRLRVEAEIIRDLSLSASGLLSTRIGGPSVRPPQPAGVYDFTQNKQAWNAAVGEDRYRRGMYTFFFRSAPYPMLATFDVPNLTQTCTARIRSNTPLQSLTLANDESLFEMAQGLASRVLSDEAKLTEPQRVARLFRLALTREPDDYELRRLVEYLGQQRARFTTDASAAAQVAPKGRPKAVTDAEAAAWTTMARAVMNLDEFITRE